MSPPQWLVLGAAHFSSLRIRVALKLRLRPSPHMRMQFSPRPGLDSPRLDVVRAFVKSIRLGLVFGGLLIYSRDLAAPRCEAAALVCLALTSGLSIAVRWTIARLAECSSTL